MKECKLHKHINTYTYTQIYTLLDLCNVQNAKISFVLIIRKKIASNLIKSGKYVTHIPNFIIIQRS